LQGCEQSPVKTYTENITINDCWFEQEDDWPATECGVLKVPEDYSKPEGQQVKLPFIIFKAINPDKKTYPLVVAGGGGPGGALGIAEENFHTFDESAWLPWYSSTIDAGRDLILIDNRGVGSSVPRLGCYEVENASMESLDKLLNKDDLVKLTREVFSACKKRLVEQDIDISQYHLINAAKDLEALRTGLGVGQLNVYGVSYGTRIALEFERLYPDSVRTLILDGIYPQSVKAYENAPRHNSEAMMRVINKCQKDKGCYDQFGFNLEERLSNFLEQLDESPITISVTSPIDYDPIDVVVTPDVFFDSLYTMMYDAYVISYIPKYMYASFNGNTDYLTEMVRDYYVNDIVNDSLDEGAYASYSCFDEIPLTDFAAARSALKKYPFQHYSNKYVFASIEAMCEVWNVPVAADEFKETYKINAPVLIYSGELDPVTPAELAKTVVENARVSWEIEWPNIAHGVMFVSECADWTAQEFLGDPESDPFIYECSDEKPKFKFVIR
jgi:pimeloyl-ACP methyl ester carboxylesterase